MKRKEEKPGKKMGRPRIEIDWKKFEALCQIQCTLFEICEVFGVTHKTLEARVKEHYKETFSQVFKQKRVGGLVSLRHNMFQLSKTNPACAIFLSKNLLGMKDKQELEHSGPGGSALAFNIQVVSPKAKELTEQILQGKRT